MGEDAPVMAERVNLRSKDYKLDKDTGFYLFTDPDTGVAKPIGSQKDVDEGYANYKGYKVYKANGTSYINDNFGASHAPVPGRPNEYFKTEIVNAQKLDRTVPIDTGASIEHYDENDYMVTPAQGSPYFVKGEEFLKLYAPQKAEGITAEALRIPNADDLEVAQGPNRTLQHWHDDTDNGTIIREYNPETGAVTKLTVTNETQEWSKTYENNKLQTTTQHTGDKVYTTNNNHEHAEDIKNLPDTQAVVDQLNENPQYRQVREIAEKAKVPDWDPKSEVDKAADEKLAQRDFEQLFMPPYEGADKVKIEKLSDSFSWTDEHGEVRQARKGDVKIFNPDGSLATVIDSHLYEQSYKDVGNGVAEWIPPQKGNQVDFYFGLTGSGKTSNIRKTIEKFGSRIVESDDRKVTMEGFHQEVSPELSPTLAERNGLGAGKLLARSNHINDLVIMKAREKGFNIVIPGVLAGDKPEWLIDVVNGFKNQKTEADVPTKIFGHFIEIPKQESARRVASRFDYEMNHETPTGARFVNPAFMVTHGDSPRANFDKMVRAMFKEGEGFDGYEIIWNFGRTPKVLEEGHRITD